MSVSAGFVWRCLAGFFFKESIAIKCETSQVYVVQKRRMVQLHDQEFEMWILSFFCKQFSI